MLRLIPTPLYHRALKLAFTVRHHWRRFSGRTGDGVSVIARDLDGRILLIRHSYGPDNWYFPGGGAGKNEAPEDAARRELREECNCDIAGLTLVGVLEEELSGAPHRAHIFTGTITDTPRPDGREVVEARFFPTHSLPEPLSPRTRARLDMWRAAGG